MSEFLVVTGLSGAGRSQAAGSLEDLGWFVIDNLPASLIEKIAELAAVPGTSIDRVALVVGRAHQLDLLPALRALRHTGHRLRILFLEASTSELVRRYGSTRRRHPLAGVGGVADAIERERALLEPLRAEADVVIDTSDLNIHQLKARLTELFAAAGDGSPMQVRVTSFGFKHGVPVDVDMVLDCRFLPNPFWVEELRPLSGLDAPVREHVVGGELAQRFVDRVDDLLGLLLPAFEAEGKTYLTVAFGCTGGQHRSVALAEEVARRLRRRGVDPAVAHRDVERAVAAGPPAGGGPPLRPGSTGPAPQGRSAPAVDR